MMFDVFPLLSSSFSSSSHCACGSGDGRRFKVKPTVGGLFELPTNSLQLF